MSQNLLSGKTGYVNTGAGNYSFGKWELDMHAKMVPVPNFNGGGFEQYVVGLVGGKATISGPYDQGNMGFTTGASYTWTLGLAPSVFLSFVGLLEGVKMSEDVDGNPVVTLTVQSNGSFTAVIT